MHAVFYIAAAVAIASTVMAITRLDAVHALLYLIVSLLAIAVVFFVLGAPFVAALEVIIYVGAAADVDRTDDPGGDPHRGVALYPERGR
jgi:NADH-quinone oxidoreductase subunit J